MAKRLAQHLTTNSLHDSHQSAYRPFHSPETALLKVHNDIVINLDSKLCSALVMLDLSAAFDVIDHRILLNRLKHSFGITSDPLAWLESYLKNRTQCVKIGDVMSSSQALHFGVPQGSVLGPVMY